MKFLIVLLILAATIVLAVGMVWLIIKLTGSTQRPTKSDLKYYEGRGRTGGL